MKSFVKGKDLLCGTRSHSPVRVLLVMGFSYDFVWAVDGDDPRVFR
jgi:hypothetical protein